MKQFFGDRGNGDAYKCVIKNVLHNIWFIIRLRRYLKQLLPVISSSVTFHRLLYDKPAFIYIGKIIIASSYILIG